MPEPVLAVTAGESYEMNHYFIKPVLIITACALPLWLLCRLIYYWMAPGAKPLSANRELIATVFVMYIAAVLAVTMIPYPLFRAKPSSAEGINLVPVVNTWQQFLSVMKLGKGFLVARSATNIFGNLLLFIPLGIFLPLLWPGLAAFKKILVIALLSSISIELFQLISRFAGIYRSVDIDDVILNTLGCLAGLAIFLACKRL